MLIGELSRRSGVPPYQLRYYEAQGLLAPARASNGYRDFDDEAVVTVNQIRRLLEAGLSTEEIAYLQPCVAGKTPEMEPCGELLDALKARLGELERRMDALTRSRDALLGYIHDAERRAPYYEAERTCPSPGRT